MVHEVILEVYSAGSITSGKSNSKKILHQRPWMAVFDRKWLDPAQRRIEEVLFVVVSCFWILFGVEHEARRAITGFETASKVLFMSMAPCRFIGICVLSWAGVPSKVGWKTELAKSRSKPARESQHNSTDTFHSPLPVPNFPSRRDPNLVANGELGKFGELRREVIGGSSRGLRGSNGAGSGWDDAGRSDLFTERDGSGEAGEDEGNGSEELHCGVVFPFVVAKKNDSLNRYVSEQAGHRQAGYNDRGYRLVEEREAEMRGWKREKSMREGWDDRTAKYWAVLLAAALREGGYQPLVEKGKSLENHRARWTAGPCVRKFGREIGQNRDDSAHNSVKTWEAGSNKLCGVPDTGKG